MRTMMKKCGVVAAFAAALLVIVALVIGCPASGPSSGPSDEFQIPEGMGAVKLNFSKTISGTPQRTILPPDATLATFAGGFSYTFTPITPAATPPGTYADGTFVNPAAVADINLVPGTYDLEVIAYLGPAAGANPAASYVEENIPITASTTTAVSVMLHPLTDGEGPGTFTWSITNTASGVTAATMTLTPIGSSALTPVDLTSNWSGSDDTLDSGYYYVDFVLSTASATLTFRHILHVYESRVSTFNYILTDIAFGIINGKAGFTGASGGDFDYEDIDLPPVLSADQSIGTLTAEDEILLSSLSTNGNPTLVTITIDNFSAYDSVEWFRGTTSVGNAATYTANTSTSPYNASGPQIGITVVGKVGTVDPVPSSTTIFIRVLD